VIPNAISNVISNALLWSPVVSGRVFKLKPRAPSSY
jgi:hypothetical protein